MRGAKDIIKYALIPVLFFSCSAQSATFEFFVTLYASDASDTNPGDGVITTETGYPTLRAAIEEANALPGEDTIILRDTFNAPPQDQIVQLSIGPVSVTDDLVIIGDALTSPTINIRWVGIQSNKAIIVEESVSLSVSNLRLNLRGWESPGILIKKGAEFSVEGDAFEPFTSNLIITDAGFSEGFGAVTNQGGTFCGNGCGFVQNGIDTGGASLYNTDGGVVEGSGWTLEDNGRLGFGAGIENVDGSISITRSFFLWNEGARGSVVMSRGGETLITNSTIAENEAKEAGGAIYVEGGTVTLVNCSIANNAVLGTDVARAGLVSGGGAIAVGPLGALVMGNTAILKNTDATGTAPDIVGHVTSLGHNLVRIADGTTGLNAPGDLTGSADQPLEILIGDFDAYAAFPVLAGSPAIDGGDISLLLDTAYFESFPMFDHQILPTPRLLGESVDIGSYEYRAPRTTHTADQDEDLSINLSELLRVIQFYNSGGYSCADDAPESEDGFAPGPPGDFLCAPHESDINPFDWAINLSELLSLIQLYNADGYAPCQELVYPGEDGYCVTG